MMNKQPIDLHQFFDFREEVKESVEPVKIKRTPGRPRKAQKRPIYKDFKYKSKAKINHLLGIYADMYLSPSKYIEGLLLDGYNLRTSRCLFKWLGVKSIDKLTIYEEDPTTSKKMRKIIDDDASLSKIKILEEALTTDTLDACNYAGANLIYLDFTSTWSGGGNAMHASALSRNIFAKILKNSKELNLLIALTMSHIKSIMTSEEIHNDIREIVMRNNWSVQIGQILNYHRVDYKTGQLGQSMTSYIMLLTKNPNEPESIHNEHQYNCGHGFCDESHIVHES